MAKTDKSVSKVTFDGDDIAAIIQNLDPDRAQGHNKLSICMLKLTGQAICKLPALIFHSYIKHGQCYSCSSKNWQTDLNKMLSSVFTPNLWKNL